MLWSVCMSLDSLFFLQHVPAVTDCWEVNGLGTALSVAERTAVMQYSSLAWIVVPCEETSTSSVPSPFRSACTCKHETVVCSTYFVVRIAVSKLSYHNRRTEDVVCF